MRPREELSPGQPDPKSEAYTPERSSVERRRCGESEGAERRDADTLAARSASGKEAVEKARKASPVWELRCFKANRANSTVAPRGAWHQNSPIREKRRGLASVPLAPAPHRPRPPPGPKTHVWGRSSVESRPDRRWSRGVRPPPPWGRCTRLVRPWAAVGASCGPTAVGCSVGVWTP